ncbi:hypothetical protein HRbin19_01366 [bacterium HR19]|nr:hypothetical protein HRbin19_01366 [bacterium HR19]
MHPDVVSKGKIFLKSSTWTTNYILKNKMYEEVNSFSYLIITDILAELAEDIEDIFLIQKNISFLFLFSDERGNMRYLQNLPPDMDDLSLFIVLLTDINFSYFHLCDFVEKIKMFYDGKLIKTWVGEVFPWGKENPADIHVNINILRAYFKFSKLCGDECSCSDDDVQEIIKNVFYEIYIRFKDYSIFAPQFYYSNQYFIMFFLLKLFEEVLPQAGKFGFDISEMHCPTYLFSLFERVLSDNRSENLSPLFLSSFLFFLSYCGFTHRDLQKAVRFISEIQNKDGSFPAENLYFDYPYHKERKIYFSKFISTSLVIYSLKRVLDNYGCWKTEEFF